MSLIYNILLIIGMNRKVKQYVVNNYFKSFNSDNVFIRLVCLLFIIAALIICLYLLYRAISNALYMYRLKTDFYKLRDLGLNVKNYNIIYFEEFKKKHIMNFSKLKNNKHTEFKNKNAIGMITDKYVVLDFDTKKDVKNADFLIDKIPKDTVCEKTPNGYHYYFENDTGKPVYTCMYWYILVYIMTYCYTTPFTLNQALSALRRRRVSAARCFRSLLAVSCLAAVCFTVSPPRRGFPRPNCHIHKLTS